MMKQLLTGLFFIAGIIFSASAQQPDFFSTKNGAINGYDVVAYFKESKAVMGKEEFSSSWQNVKWKFSSKANLDTFTSDPHRFAPQYGGYCAFGVSENHKSATDPNAWKVIDNKLYLNYNKNVQQEWLKSTDQRINAADRYWPALKDK